MSVIGSQQRTFLRLLELLRPHWRRDPALPARIQSLLTARKDFGARDRRLYRELIFTTLRYLPWIEPLLDSDPPRAAKIVAWLAADTRDTMKFRAELAGDWPAAASLRERSAFLGADASALVPEWFRAECPALFDPAELEVQVMRAALWLRLQTRHRAVISDEFVAKGWHWRESPLLSSAWQLLEDADVTAADAYRNGAIEIQDLGSQLLLETIGVSAGTRWLDACAGAGGKTLQLARLLGPSGCVDAHDIRAAALDELAARALRAASVATSPISPDRGAMRRRTPLVIRDIPDASPIRLLPIGPDAVGQAVGNEVSGYDGVLVDAPCSGSGTWRRAPHLKWTTTPEIVRQRAALQQQLLAQFAAFVRPGGQLVYATCSLARSENETVVGAFLASHPDFSPAPLARTFDFAPPGHALTIFPARHNTDGFFVASFQRRS